MRLHRLRNHQPNPLCREGNTIIRTNHTGCCTDFKVELRDLIDYTRYRPDTIPYTLEHDGREQRYYIPEKVMELFNDEFDYREVANCQELTNLAVALFIGMAGGPAATPSGGDSGSSTDNNWGRDKDEDDLRWAHRCTKVATQKLGKQLRHGLRR